MPNEITATVPQGIGDIFWCYQKLQPLYDAINFRIAVSNGQSEIERRAENVIRYLPGVKTVECVKLDRKNYNDLIMNEHTLDDLMSGKSEFFNCNHFLDRGTRLEDIDNHPIAYDIALPQEPLDGLPDDYVLFYVSGGTGRSNDSWGINEWVDLINMTKQAHKLPIVLIGASFDSAVMSKIYRKTAVSMVCDAKPAHLFYMLANCRFFVGYQSGLSILADNFGTKHLIIYFNKLRPMAKAWGHPGRRDSHFYYCTFRDGVDHAASIIRVM